MSGSSSISGLACLIWIDNKIAGNKIKLVNIEMINVKETNIPNATVPPKLEAAKMAKPQNKIMEV